MTRLIVAVIGMFALLSAYAEPLDKSNSFTVEQDADTGAWRLECVIEVSPIARQEWHIINIQVVKSSVNGPTTILERAGIEVSPDQRSVVDYADGLYAFEIKKFGERIRIAVEANWPSIANRDGFLCGISLSEGRPGANRTLHNADMRHTIGGVSP